MYHWKQILPGDDYTDALSVRIAVFVREQGFSAEQEEDATDPAALHLVAYDGSLPIATGRLYAVEKGGPCHIGRVAILPSYRGRDLGLHLMERLEACAREAGAKSAVLSAQYRAQRFYEKGGYTAGGEPYYDEHRLHIDMKKPL